MIEFLFSQYGLLGLFIASIVGNATVLFPMPIDIFVFAVAALADNPLLVLIIGLVSGTGAAIGEMSAYILGYLGVKSLEKVRKSEIISIKDLQEKLEKGGMWIVFLGALTPFPFDVIGVAAGLIKYNPRRFFAAAWAGKTLRYCLIAYAGFYGMQIVKAWFIL
jgi:membrane protein YqaA with SNARE-associated domain